MEGDAVKKLIFLLIMTNIAWAGWDDLSFDSPQHASDFHQGDPLTLSLVITNNGRDGTAAYITNVTLYPPPCVNMGLPITRYFGTVLCPEDPTCKLMFRSARRTAEFLFENLTTDRMCVSGASEYRFAVEGSSELLAGTGKWSDLRRTETKSFRLRFVGPSACGDGECSGTEDCSSCPQDCGRCPECAEGTRTCLNNSVVECEGGFFTKVVERCEHGCVAGNGTAACRRICEEGTRRCVGNVLQTCVNGSWTNQTCPYGCENSLCTSDPCAGVRCEPKCENGTAYWNGLCDAETGFCVYYSSERCEYGCDGASCASPPAQERGGEGSACASMFLALALLLLMNK